MITKSRISAKTPDQKRRKKILDGYGKFANVKTSSKTFAKAKVREIHREDRHVK